MKTKQNLTQSKLNSDYKGWRSCAIHYDSSTQKLAINKNNSLCEIKKKKRLSHIHTENNKGSLMFLLDSLYETNSTWYEIHIHQIQNTDTSNTDNWLNSKPSQKIQIAFHIQHINFDLCFQLTQFLTFVTLMFKSRMTGLTRYKWVPFWDGKHSKSIFDLCL